ncbi:Ribosomal protein S12, mitochondrial [Ananas comosus]|uniref:Ribosomal protein S12, mitochondrial n=1 Tax=Ananas comosus TaxID=4615 RepID=A0A199UHN4_ANACO|nr:Ribosomal protein S12, mitochondrial [Ananas comosus]
MSGMKPSREQTKRRRRRRKKKKKKKKKGNEGNGGKDSPGVKSHCIRGVKDLLGIPDRRRGRSKYGCLDRGKRSSSFGQLS